MTDRTSWDIKDTAVAAELLQMMDLSEAEKQLLASMQAAAEAEAVHLADAFYARAQAHEPSNEYLKDANVEHLHGTLQDWFKGLFTGQYDASYAEKRMRIGITHVRIGLPVRYPLAMLDLLQQHGDNVAGQFGEEGIKAFRKILALDIAIFNQAYEDNQLKHLSELAGSERLARRLLQGEF